MKKRTVEARFCFATLLTNTHSNTRTLENAAAFLIHKTRGRWRQRRRQRRNRRYDRYETTTTIAHKFLLRSNFSKWFVCIHRQKYHVFTFLHSCKPFSFVYVALCTRTHRQTHTCTIMHMYENISRYICQ